MPRFPYIFLIIILNSFTGFAAVDIINADSVFNFSSQKPLIPDMNDGYGIAFRDINNDNIPDIYLICFRGLNRLLINPGMGKSFRDATIISGLGGNLMPQKINNLELGSAIADFDNDNDPDVIIAGWGNSTNYFRNGGNLQFSIHSRRLNLELPFDFNTAIAGDVNNDGDLDIFLTDEHYTNRLLLNEGNAIFKDITNISGVEYGGVSQGAGFCDIDNDGDLDLYVANWFDRDIFYKNVGNSKFVDAELDIEVCMNKINTNAVSFADLDNDGDFDFLVTNRQGRNYLYLNNIQAGDSIWHFNEAGREVSLIDSSVSYGSVIADFNNDGWQDIFVTNIGPNQFYINKGNGTFLKIYEDTVSGSRLIKELVENLKRFSHLDQAKLQKVDLHEGIESSLKILKSQLKNRIEVHKNYKAKDWVECNPGQINQVFLNLLSNAAQAIKNKGNIWIETKQENDYFVVEIKDDGKGMPQNILPKIFDPFFTTKDVGEGTGLGLSISYSIIKNHGGMIKVESIINKGSVFRIKLPRKKG